MPLTNAERQRRFRKRLRAGASAAVGLTPEQCADRDAVMAEPLYPVPPVDRRAQMPRQSRAERQGLEPKGTHGNNRFGTRGVRRGKGVTK